MTVGDLERRLGSGYELTEWMAFYQILEAERKKADKEAQAKHKAPSRR